MVTSTISDDLLKQEYFSHNDFIELQANKSLNELTTVIQQQINEDGYYTYSPMPAGQSSMTHQDMATTIDKGCIRVGLWSPNANAFFGAGDQPGYIKNSATLSYLPLDSSKPISAIEDGFGINQFNVRYFLENNDTIVKFKAPSGVVTEITDSIGTKARTELIKFLQKYPDTRSESGRVFNTAYDAKISQYSQAVKDLHHGKFDTDGIRLTEYIKPPSQSAYDNILLTMVCLGYFKKATEINWNNFTVKFATREDTLEAINLIFHHYTAYHEYSRTDNSSSQSLAFYFHDGAKANKKEGDEVYMKASWAYSAYEFVAEDETVQADPAMIEHINQQGQIFKDATVSIDLYNGNPSELIDSQARRDTEISQRAALIQAQEQAIQQARAQHKPEPTFDPLPSIDPTRVHLDFMQPWPTEQARLQSCTKPIPPQYFRFVVPYMGDDRTVEYLEVFDDISKDGTITPLSNYNELNNINMQGHTVMDKDEWQRCIDPSLIDPNSAGFHTIELPSPASSKSPHIKYHVAPTGEYLFLAQTNTGQVTPIIRIPVFNAELTREAYFRSHTVETAKVTVTTNDEIAFPATCSLDMMLALTQIFDLITPKTGAPYVFMNPNEGRSFSVNPLADAGHQLESQFAYRWSISGTELKIAIQTLSDQLTNDFGYPEDFEKIENCADHHKLWLPRFLKTDDGGFFHFATNMPVFDDPNAWTDDKPDYNGDGIIDDKDFVVMGEAQFTRRMAAYLCVVLSLLVEESKSIAPDKRDFTEESMATQGELSASNAHRNSLLMLAGFAAMNYLQFRGSKKLMQDNMVLAGASGVSKENYLLKYGSDLLAQAEAKFNSTGTVGRDDVIRSTVEILTAPEGRPSSVAFTGPAGTGKSFTAVYLAELINLANIPEGGETAYINRLLRTPNLSPTQKAAIQTLPARIERARRMIPRQLWDCRFIQLDINAMKANTAYRGQAEAKVQAFIAAATGTYKPELSFPQRLKELMKWAWLEPRRVGFEIWLSQQVQRSKAGDGKLVIFIDEAHTAGAKNAQGEIGFDLWEPLKPYLATGEITLLIASTDEEIQILFKDKALKRRLSPVPITELPREQVLPLIEREARRTLESKMYGDRFNHPDHLFRIMMERHARQTGQDPLAGISLKNNRAFIERLYESAPFYFEGARPSCTNQLAMQFISYLYMERWVGKGDANLAAMRLQRRIDDYNRELSLRYRAAWKNRFAGPQEGENMLDFFWRNGWGAGQAIWGWTKGGFFGIPGLTWYKQRALKKEIEGFWKSIETEWLETLNDLTIPEELGEVTDQTLTEFMQSHPPESLVTIQNRIDVKIDSWKVYGLVRGTPGDSVTSGSLGYDGRYKILRTDANGRIDFPSEIMRYNSFDYVIDLIDTYLKKHAHELNATSFDGHRSRHQVIQDYCNKLFQQGELTPLEIAELEGFLYGGDRLTRLSETADELQKEMESRARRAEENRIRDRVTLIFKQELGLLPLSEENRTQLRDLFSKINRMHPDETADEFTTRNWDLQAQIQRCTQEVSALLAEIENLDQPPSDEAKFKRLQTELEAATTRAFYNLETTLYCFQYRSPAERTRIQRLYDAFHPLEERMRNECQDMELMSRPAGTTGPGVELHIADWLLREFNNILQKGPSETNASWNLRVDRLTRVIQGVAARTTGSPHSLFLELSSELEKFTFEKMGSSNTSPQTQTPSHTEQTPPREPENQLDVTREKYKKLQGLDPAQLEGITNLHDLNEAVKIWLDTLPEAHPLHELAREVQELKRLAQHRIELQRFRTSEARASGLDLNFAHRDEVRGELLERMINALIETRIAEMESGTSDRANVADIIEPIISADGILTEAADAQRLRRYAQEIDRHMTEDVIPNRRAADLQPPVLTPPATPRPESTDFTAEGLMRQGFTDRGSESILDLLHSTEPGIQEFMDEMKPLIRRATPQTADSIARMIAEQLHIMTQDTPSVRDGLRQGVDIWISSFNFTFRGGPRPTGDGNTALGMNFGNSRFNDATSVDFQSATSSVQREVGRAYGIAARMMIEAEQSGEPLDPDKIIDAYKANYLERHPGRRPPEMVLTYLRLNVRQSLAGANWFESLSLRVRLRHFTMESSNLNFRPDETALERSLKLELDYLERIQEKHPDLAKKLGSEALSSLAQLMMIIEQTGDKTLLDGLSAEMAEAKLNAYREALIAAKRAKIGSETEMIDNALEATERLARRYESKHPGTELKLVERPPSGALETLFRNVQGQHGHAMIGMALWIAGESILASMKMPSFSFIDTLYNFGKTFAYSSANMAAFMGMDKIFSKGLVVATDWGYLCMFPKNLKGPRVYLNPRVCQGVFASNVNSLASTFSGGLLPAAMAMGFAQYYLLQPDVYDELQEYANSGIASLEAIEDHAFHTMVMKSFLIHGIAFGAGMSVGGATFGALVGTSICPVAGTIIGGIVGLGAGMVTSLVAEHYFDKWDDFDTEEQLKGGIQSYLSKAGAATNFHIREMGNDEWIHEAKNAPANRNWDSYKHAARLLSTKLASIQEFSKMLEQLGQDADPNKAKYLKQLEAVANMTYVEALDHLNIRNIDIELADFNVSNLLGLLLTGAKFTEGSKSLKINRVNAIEPYEGGIWAFHRINIHVDGGSDPGDYVDHLGVQLYEQDAIAYQQKLAKYQEEEGDDAELGSLDLSLSEFPPDRLKAFFREQKEQGHPITVDYEGLTRLLFDDRAGSYPRTILRDLIAIFGPPEGDTRWLSADFAYSKGKEMLYFLDGPKRREVIKYLIEQINEFKSAFIVFEDLPDNYLVEHYNDAVYEYLCDVYPNRSTRELLHIPESISSVDDLPIGQDVMGNIMQCYTTYARKNPPEELNPELSFNTLQLMLIIPRQAAIQEKEDYDVRHIVDDLVELWNTGHSDYVNALEQTLQAVFSLNNDDTESKFILLFALRDLLNRNTDLKTLIERDTGLDLTTLFEELESASLEYYVEQSFFPATEDEWLVSYDVFAESSPNTVRDQIACLLGAIVIANHELGNAITRFYNNRRYDLAQARIALQEIRDLGYNNYALYLDHEFNKIPEQATTLTANDISLPRNVRETDAAYYKRWVDTWVERLALKIYYHRLVTPIRTKKRHHGHSLDSAIRVECTEYLNQFIDAKSQPHLLDELFSKAFIKADAMDLEEFDRILALDHMNAIPEMIEYTDQFGYEFIRNNWSLYNQTLRASHQAPDRSTHTEPANTNGGATKTIIRDMVSKNQTFGTTSFDWFVNGDENVTAILEYLESTQFKIYPNDRIHISDVQYVLWTLYEADPELKALVVDTVYSNEVDTSDMRTFYLTFKAPPDTFEMLYALEADVVSSYLEKRLEQRQEQVHEAHFLSGWVEQMKDLNPEFVFDFSEDASITLPGFHHEHRVPVNALEFVSLYIPQIALLLTERDIDPECEPEIFEEIVYETISGEASPNYYMDDNVRELLLDLCLYNINNKPYLLGNIETQFTQLIALTAFNQGIDPEYDPDAFDGLVDDVLYSSMPGMQASYERKDFFREQVMPYFHDPDLLFGNPEENTTGIQVFITTPVREAYELLLAQDREAILSEPLPYEHEEFPQHQTTIASPVQPEFQAESELEENQNRWLEMMSLVNPSYEEFMEQPLDPEETNELIIDFIDFYSPQIALVALATVTDPEEEENMSKVVLETLFNEAYYDFQADQSIVQTLATDATNYMIDDVREDLYAEIEISYAEYPESINPSVHHAYHVLTASHLKTVA